MWILLEQFTISVWHCFYRSSKTSNKCTSIFGMALFFFIFSEAFLDKDPHFPLNSDLFVHRNSPWVNGCELLRSFQEAITVFLHLVNRIITTSFDLIWYCTLCEAKGFCVSTPITNYQQEKMRFRQLHQVFI